MIKIGNYLDKPVAIKFLENPRGIDKGESFCKDLLLLFVEREERDGDIIENLLSVLKEDLPLAIVLGGNISDENFSYLLERLSENQKAMGVMTKVASGENFLECCEDFMQATWPSETHFDQWEGYKILVCGKLSKEQEQQKLKCLSGLLD